MTHSEFWKLYDSKQINIKIFDGDTDYVHMTIESFTYNGKYYLRIHKRYNYTTGKRSYGKRYKMEYEDSYIKEFTTISHANNYFKKITQNKLKRIA